MPLNHMCDAEQQRCISNDVNLNTQVISINGQTGRVFIRPIDIGAIADPFEKKNGQYLRFMNGEWVADDVSANSSAEFDEILHVVSL